MCDKIKIYKHLGGYCGKMKKLLITGFEPFGGESINPSWESVLRLPDLINGYEIIKLCIPVVFGDAAKIVLREAENTSPSVIISIGQAGGRSAITPELVGINFRNATIPDNNGNLPREERILEKGNDAYFSTLPVSKMADAIKNCGIPSVVSYSAGAYVCNDLLYTLLAHYKNTDTRIGFIHIPYCPEQNKEPSMSIDEAVKGIITAIESID
jgi:pyroglutamyl-peptidase